MNSCTYDMISTFYLKSLSPQKRGVKSENSTITERNTMYKDFICGFSKHQSRNLLLVQ